MKASSVISIDINTKLKSNAQANRYEKELKCNKNIDTSNQNFT
jgi:hypothetical protein